MNTGLLHTTHMVRIGFNVAVLILALFALVLVQKDSSSPMSEQYWRERIHKLGAEEAYREFTAFQRTQPEEYDHQFSHLFGAALYRAGGPGALSVCEFESQTGCLHEFFRQHAQVHGLGSLARMEAECELSEGAAGACQHAIGHGILDYFGYDRTGLLKALALCDSSFEHNQVLGCPGGVFMEYNGYVTLNPKDAPRAPEPSWYGVCEDVPEQFQRSCVWWLPRWWSEYFTENPSSMSIIDRYKQMAQLCRELPLEKYRRECFEHVGQTASGAVRYDPEKVKNLCAVTTENHTEELYCLSYAASMFVNSSRETFQPFGSMVSIQSLPTQAAAMEICADLPAASREFCNAYAENKNYLDNERPLPANVQ